MQKINFQNLPNTTTPINATNLNAIQTNAEDAINGVASDLSNLSSDVSDVAGDLSSLSTSLSNYVNGTTAMGTINTTGVLINNTSIIDSGYVSPRGYYIKFSDGTLIQWNRFSATDQAINNAYGNLYLGNRTITFPIAFVGNLPACHCSDFQHGSSASWGTVGTITLTTLQCRGLDAYTRATGTETIISWIAIGKWK